MAIGTVRRNLHIWGLCIHICRWHVCRYTCAWMYVHREARDQDRKNIVCLPQSLFTLFLRQGLSLNWKFMNLSRLVEQPTPGVLLSPLLLYRELQVQEILCSFLCVCWESELSTSCLHNSPLLKSLPQSQWFAILRYYIKNHVSRVVSDSIASTILLLSL